MCNCHSLLRAVKKLTSKVKQLGRERDLGIREREKRWEISHFSGVHRVTQYKTWVSYLGRWIQKTQTYTTGCLQYWGFLTLQHLNNFEVKRLLSRDLRRVSTPKNLFLSVAKSAHFIVSWNRHHIESHCWATWHSLNRHTGGRCTTDCAVVNQL